MNTSCPTRTWSRTSCGVHVTPSDVGTGLIFLDFKLDQPASFAPGVTSKDVATELDGYTDWKVNDNFTVSFVLAFGESAGSGGAGFRRTRTSPTAWHLSQLTSY